MSNPAALSRQHLFSTHARASTVVDMVAWALLAKFLRRERKGVEERGKEGRGRQGRGRKEREGGEQTKGGRDSRDGTGDRGNEGWLGTEGMRVWGGGA